MSASLSTGSYLVGIAALAAMAAPAVAAGVHVRRRLLPAWRSAPAVLATAIIAIAIAVAAAQIAGLAGALSVAGVTASSVVLAIAVTAAARHLTPVATAEPHQPAPVHRIVSGAALLAGIAVFAQWAHRVAFVIERGITELDSLYYHLPNAVAFAQSGRVTDLHYTSPDPLTAFHPATGELVHALGMVAFDRDVLSPFVNLGWLALALLAGWCIGRPFGAAPATFAATALVAGAPILVDTQPGSAQVDIAGLALLLTAVALALHTRSEWQVLVLAGAAAGLAAGVKLTFLPPLAALTVGVVAAAGAGRRRPALLAWTVPLALMAVLWYARNAIATGNPIPGLASALEGLGLPGPTSPMLEHLGGSVSDFATEPRVLRRVVMRGIRPSLGPAWPVVLGFAGIGIVAAASRWGNRELRVVAAVGAVAGAAYIVTPYTAMGDPVRPTEFAVGVRFLAPFLVTGLALLALIRPMRGSLQQTWLVAAFVSLVAVTGFATGAYIAWPRVRLEVPVAVGAVTAAAGALGVVLGRRGLPAPALAFGLVAVLAAAGLPLQDRYVANRYRPQGHFPAYDDVWAWGDARQEARIAVSGFVPIHPLHGADLSNAVGYIGDEQADGSFTRIATCEEWVDALAEGGYDFVVVEPYDPAEFLLFTPATRRAPAEAWTLAVPAASVVLRAGSKAVIELPDRIDSGC